MRVVVQRVRSASVSVDGAAVAEIGTGLLLLLGIRNDDTRADIDYIVDKTLNLRIFPDASGIMNTSVVDNDFELLVVSQFTLYGDARKGRRPSYNSAAGGKPAEDCYMETVNAYKKSGVRCSFGVFKADMNVELVNHGPVTILLDSRKEF